MKLNYYDAMREYGGVSFAPPVIIPSIPDTIAVPENVVINATVTTEPPNQSCTYEWSVTSTQEDAKVNNPGSKMAGFNSAGLFPEDITLSLKVTDENGLSSTATKVVSLTRISSRLQLSFANSPPDGQYKCTLFANLSDTQPIFHGDVVLTNATCDVLVWDVSGGSQVIGQLAAPDGLINVVDSTKEAA